MPPVDVLVIGADAVAKELQRELTVFQRQFVLKARDAGNMLRNEVRRGLGATFHPTDAALYSRRGGLRKGRPGAMKRNVVRLVTYPKGSVNPEEIAVFVQYGRRAYYGIHETGGVIEAKGQNAVNVAFRAQQNRSRLGRGRAPLKPQARYLMLVFPTGEFRFVPRVMIPARPVFGPVAAAKGEAAAEIIGDSFEAFGPGAR